MSEIRSEEQPLIGGISKWRRVSVTWILCFVWEQQIHTLTTLLMSKKTPHPLVFIWISSICVEFHPGEGEISWIMIFFHLSAFVRVASQGPCGVTAEALTTAWPPSSPLPRFSPLGEKNSSCNCSSLVCDPLILKHSLNKTTWLFWVVIGANCCRVRAADTVYYCGPFSGGHRITQDQVLVGRTKKKKGSHLT